MSDSIRDPTTSDQRPSFRAIPSIASNPAYAQDTRNASASVSAPNLAWRDGTTEHAHPGNDLLASDCDLSVRSVHTEPSSLS